MIQEISNYQEDEEKNSIKFSDFDYKDDEGKQEQEQEQKQKKKESTNAESIKDKFVKNRKWKIHVSVGKTLHAYIHFHSKKIRKWDFIFPLQYEGLSSMGNIFSGALYPRGTLYLLYSLESCVEK